MLLPVEAAKAEMPSTSCRSSPVRNPFVLDVPDPPPMLVTTPGRSCSKRWKFRPFKGSEVITELVIVPPRVASVVLTEGASEVTVTVCVCAPGDSVKSTRMFLPTSTMTLACYTV